MSLPSAGLAVAAGPSVVTRVHAPFSPAAGPVFLGSKIAWVNSQRRRGRRHGQPNAMRLVVDSQGHRSLKLFPRAHPGRGTSVSEQGIQGLLGSGGFVATIRQLDVCSPGYACGPKIELLAGRIGGPLRVITTDRGSQTDLISQSTVSISGSELAYVWDPHPYTSSYRPRVVVQDLRRRGSRRVITELPRVRPNQGIQKVVIRGNLLAWSYGGRLVRRIKVFSLTDHRILHAVEASRLHAAGILNWDLEPNGTMAIAYLAGNRQSLAWTEPPYRRMHHLHGVWPGPSHISQDEPDDVPLEIRSGRIALWQYGQHLAVVGLSGRYTLIRRTSDKRSLGMFDFNGRRLVWTEFHATGSKTDCNIETCTTYSTGPLFIMSQSVRRAG
jgi:hypothetical protein